MRTDDKISSQNDKKVITANNKSTEVLSILSRLTSQSTISAENIRLLTARDVGTILGVNSGTIYELWNNGLMDFWEINGTRRTNLIAIADFLTKVRNRDLASERSRK